MRKLVLSLLFASALFAQNPNSAVYPARVALDTDLYVATNLGATTLNGTILAGATSMLLNSSTGFVAPVVVVVDSEIFHCNTLTLTLLSGCTPGSEGTVQANHTSGATVKNVMTAWHHNQMAAEVKAIETRVGAGGTTGSILFMAPGAVFAQDNLYFFYDSAHKCLAVGTNSCTGNVIVLQGQAGAAAQATFLSSGAQQASFSFWTNNLGRFQVGAQANGDIFFYDATNSRDFIDEAASTGKLTLQAGGGPFAIGTLAGSGARCVHTDNAGNITVAAADCSTGGSGTVTTVSGSGPSWLTWTVTNPTTTPAISLAPTTAQTTHQVIGTCGAATTFTPCALVAGDLPATTVNAVTNDTNVTGSISAQNFTLGWTGTLAATRMVNAGVHTGDSTSTFPAVTISAGAITLAKMANLAANSFVCNNTGAGATPIACTIAQSKALLAIACADLTNAAASCATDATNATNIGSGTLAAARLPSAGVHSGDAVGTFPAVTLNTVNSNVGTFGDSTHVAQVTVNGKGLVTAVSSVAAAGGGGNTLTAVTFSATPTFTRSTANQEWSITLTGNVTSSTLSGAAAGDILVFNITQDATGGRTFAWPTGFTEACTINSTLNIGTKQTFYWDGSAAHAITPCVTTVSTSDLVLTDAVNTATAAFTLDASAATTANAVKTQVKAGATATANGAIAYDSTNNMLHAGQSAADAMVPQFTVTPVNSHCASWVVSGSNYKLGDTTCGTGSGTLPYSTTTITASPMAITAATHGQGSKAFGICWDSSSNPQVMQSCNWSRNPGTGDLTLTYTTAPAQIDIFGGTGGFANPLTTAGDVMYGGAAGLPTRLAIGGANTLLHGGASAPAYSAVVPADFGSSIAARSGLSNATSAAAAPTFSTTEDRLAYQTAEIPAYVFVTASFTTSGSGTALEAITGLTWTMPGSTALNIPYHCALVYHQNVAAVAVAFGFQNATTGATNLLASGQMNTSASVIAAANVANTTATTATSVVSGTPSAITTNWNATLDGLIEQPSGTASVFTIRVSTATAADTVTVLRGSYCRIG